LGGVKGILLLLGTIFTKVFSVQMAEGLKNMAYNLTYTTAGAQAQAKALRQEAISNLKNSGSGSGIETDVYSRMAES
jgi:hypothetical protein